MGTEPAAIRQNPQHNDCHDRFNNDDVQDRGSLLNHQKPEEHIQKNHRDHANNEASRNHTCAASDNQKLIFVVLWFILLFQCLEECGHTGNHHDHSNDAGEKSRFRFLVPEPQLRKSNHCKHHSHQCHCDRDQLF